MMNNLGLGIIVSLKDAFTQNAARIQSSMQVLDSSVEKASENMTRNLGLIERGTMMVGAGLALLAVPTTLVASTAATQKALGELASVGVKDFRAMEDAAESFTNQWAGSSKAELISAAYDVKSALSGLSDEAVGVFTQMAALTAKATKASTAEMVGTFTTAYGIFRPIMADMSDMDWATTFSGAMSKTVQSFKTTGAQMAEAIKNIGATAAASNIPLAEQLAILGQLQTTMPGSEAGTLYKAFIMKAAEAGDSLRLSFVGADGRLKDIMSILAEVKTRFPDLSQAAAQVEIKKAFGSDEAVKFLLQMSMGMQALGSNIRGIEQAMSDGTFTTEKMAQAMNQDIGSQLGLVKQQVANLAEILGRTLLPIVTPVFQGISRFVLRLQDMARSMPGVTRVALTLCAALGAALVVVGGVTAALGTAGIMLPAIKVGIAALGPMLAGVGSAVSACFWPVVAVIGAVAIAVIALKHVWETNFAGIRDVVMGAWNKVSLAFQGIRALFGSLSGGTGQMSADLAEKLQAAGLMKFVITVFRVYHRVRQFLIGLWQAFSSVFGKVRAILQPAVRALMGAFGELGKALGSVLAAFGVATTAVDASSFESFGKTLGTVLSVISQVAAYVIKFIVYPLSGAIRIVATIVRAVVWLEKTIVTALVAAAPYVYRFSLPLRMLVQGLLMVGRVARAAWRMVTGGVSVVDGLRSIGDAVFRYLATPFLWVRDTVSSVWGFLRRVFSSMGELFRSAGSALLSAIQSLPIVGTIAQVFDTLRSFVLGQTDVVGAGRRIVVALAQGMLSVVSLPSQALGAAYRSMLSATSWVWDKMRTLAAGLISAAFQSGRSMMATIASGIRSAMSVPYEAAKSVLSRLRKLLPFSDAQEGPLSTLTRSGTAMLEAFSSGIARASELPARALESSLGAARSLMSIGLPTSALAATLALTPVMAGAVPDIAPVEPVVAQSADRSRLLAATRGSLASPETPGIAARTGDLRPVLEAILAKLGGLSERPIEVSVTTKLDGRQIAQAVYKDMRERKVRNYESA